MARDWTKGALQVIGALCMLVSIGFFVWAWLYGRAYP